ncbi:MAG: enoyl-CoA hydratase/isomerase family protein, partial [Actinomycetota bacterium]|nr:enoyl-CoA hydratase/isomerase family protein [Actinomycetota bacterium]
IDNPPINLITIPLLLDFISLTKWAQDDEESTVLVLRSNVEGFFIAHFDVEALLSMNSEAASTSSSVTSFDELCLRFQKMNKVTICVIEGRVGGGGSEIAMACDLRFAATETAVMNQMEVPIGIIPGGGGTQRLPELVGYSRALELIVGGLDLDAATGEKWGYFNRALPKRELDEYMEKLLNRIASFNTESVRSAKEALQLTQPDLVPGLIAENAFFNSRNYSDSGVKLMRRFLQLGGQTKDQESRIEEFALEVAKGEIKPDNNNLGEP